MKVRTSPPITAVCTWGEPGSVERRLHGFGFVRGERRHSREAIAQALSSTKGPPLVR